MKENYGQDQNIKKQGSDKKLVRAGKGFGRNLEYYPGVVFAGRENEVGTENEASRKISERI